MKRVQNDRTVNFQVWLTCEISWMSFLWPDLVCSQRRDQLQVGGLHGLKPRATSAHDTAMPDETARSRRVLLVAGTAGTKLEGSPTGRRCRLLRSE